MLNWLPSWNKSRTSESRKPRAGSRLPQNVARISLEIPSYKIETADFYVDNEVDSEKMGGLSPDYGEFPPNYSRPNESDHHPNNNANYISDPIDEDDNAKPPLEHKLFDLITRHAGSRYVLVVTIILLLIWILFGAVYGPTDIWQIVIQNASSVQVYLTDILLIRQQHTSSRSLLQTLAKMQSRDRTYTRLIRKIPQNPSPSKEALGNRTSVSSEPGEIYSLTELVQPETDSSRTKAIFDESCRIIAAGLGSVWAYIIYWIGICVWLGIGTLFNFADTWQLYINTAVAVALTFTSIFLQNRQQQQEDTLDRALEYSMKIDKDIEFRLREMTGDVKANDLVVIETQKVGWIEKGVDWFAAMMGSLIGVLITIIFFVIWILIGPLLAFRDDWWLIIGTFTGLLGFIDGFVLRNIYARESKTVNHELEKIAAADTEVLSRIKLSYAPLLETKLSLSSRISGKIGDWCALPSVSLASLLFVIALLLIATAMHWTTTGQLLCNTPTMIIEGFLLLVLIEAHCIANEVRERHLRNILERRMILSRYLRESMVEMLMDKPEAVAR